MTSACKAPEKLQHSCSRGTCSFHLSVCTVISAAVLNVLWDRYSHTEALLTVHHVGINLIDGAVTVGLVLRVAVPLGWILVLRMGISPAGQSWAFIISREN